MAEWPPVPSPPLPRPAPYAPRDPQDPYPLHPERWDLRADQSKKGNGFLGPIIRPDGRGLSSEISIGVSLDGKEMDIPSMVPALTHDEVLALMTQPTDARGGFTNFKLPDSVLRKAVDHARQRLAQGLPVFAQPGEENLNLLPQFPRAGQPAPGAWPPDPVRDLVRQKLKAGKP